MQLKVFAATTGPCRAAAAGMSRRPHAADFRLHRLSPPPRACMKASPILAQRGLRPTTASPQALRLTAALRASRPPARPVHVAAAASGAAVPPQADGGSGGGAASGGSSSDPKQSRPATPESLAAARGQMDSEIQSKMSELQRRLLLAERRLEVGAGCCCQRTAAPAAAPHDSRAGRRLARGRPRYPEGRPEPLTRPYATPACQSHPCRRSVSGRRCCSRIAWRRPSAVSGAARCFLLSLLACRSAWLQGQQRGRVQHNPAQPGTRL